MTGESAGERVLFPCFKVVSDGALPQNVADLQCNRGEALVKVPMLRSAATREPTLAECLSRGSRWREAPSFPTKFVPRRTVETVSGLLVIEEIQCGLSVARAKPQE